MKYDVICHHGIKGQRWGVRRYQNEDGSLTNAGKQRAKSEGKELTAEQKEKRKKIAKGVAIGAGSAAVVAGAAYLGARGIAANIAGDITAKSFNSSITSKQKELMRNATYWDDDTGIIGAIKRHSSDYKSYKNYASVQINKLEKEKISAGKAAVSLFFDKDFKLFS